MKSYTLAALFILSIGTISAQQADDVSITIGRLKYGGGGDWYQDQSALPNLIDYLNKVAPVKGVFTGKYVEPGSKDLFEYPILWMTGHGNVKFTEDELQRLRLYLTSGGFLWADDCYGMDKSFRREMKRLFPDNELVELPFNHPIYHCFYDFPNGPPKIHEHDGLPAQGLGIFYQGRLVVFYTYQTDIGDGMEDITVHNDPPEKHEAALKFGTNVIIYALTH
jgi:hypothetical protein